MNFDPSIHHRKSIRLPGYDYSQPGAYFITICTHQQKHRFGKITNGEMFQNPLGQIAASRWATLPDRFQNIELGQFVVMPNHIHGILILRENRAATMAAPTVGELVGSYKSLVMHDAILYYQSLQQKIGLLWQRNYWEHIIRTEKDHQVISTYIQTNPATWQRDDLFAEYPL